MIRSTSFSSLDLSVKDSKAWLFSGIFIAGNLALPQLCHLIPGGGLIFLPIYFFTLIAAYKFGWKVGLLTAVLSPLMNYLIFGMPVAAMLPIILIKSVILAVLAAVVANRSKTINLLVLALVVVGYQVLGGLVEGLLAQNLLAGVQDFRIGFPGLLFQLLGGWMVLKGLSKYER
jgi:hypothetical protein